jgi:hypothetical protein
VEKKKNFLVKWEISTCLSLSLAEDEVEKGFTETHYLTVGKPTEGDKK